MTDLLKQMAVKLPPLSEQRAIASVLGSLDDKIELNRRMNETLEALAQSLFKSWFVDATQSALPKSWREVNRRCELTALLGGTPIDAKHTFGGGNIPGSSSGKANEFRIMNRVNSSRKLVSKNRNKAICLKHNDHCDNGCAVGQLCFLEIEGCANRICSRRARLRQLPERICSIVWERKYRRACFVADSGARDTLESINVNALQDCVARLGDVLRV